MELANVTPQQLRKAADIQERIQSLQRELASLLGDRIERAPSAPAGGKKRGLSAAGRAAIAAAARARWAKVRAGKPPKAPVPKRKISAAGRARLAAAARERWKKAKAAGKSRL